MNSKQRLSFSEGKCPRLCAPDSCRVRWALEEVGQPCEVRLISFGAMKEPAHRARATRPGSRSACLVEDRIRNRLGELSGRLGDADWLDGAFNAGDLLMVAVLRWLNGSGILDEYPNLSAYVARGEARPAFKRAFDAQLVVFTGIQKHASRKTRS